MSQGPRGSEGVGECRAASGEEAHPCDAVMAGAEETTASDVHGGSGSFVTGSSGGLGVKLLLAQHQQRPQLPPERFGEKDARRRNVLSKLQPLGGDVAAAEPWWQEQGWTPEEERDAPVKPPSHWEQISDLELQQRHRTGMSALQLLCCCNTAAWWPDSQTGPTQERTTVF
ncbi:unnamed protein product [Pleuronectes platessa]|uniref:Uncharacterized protein n=1 Tax=Pleuronectes platessa TaxID=8262 RepID=A0A9N7V7C8_PLEPL|nr:unnamed protein product [Pleuronectes platessa]